MTNKETRNAVLRWTQLQTLIPAKIASSPLGEFKIQQLRGFVYISLAGQTLHTAPHMEAAQLYCEEHLHKTAAALHSFLSSADLA